MPPPFSPGSNAKRDRWASTWPLRAAQARRSLVPVGDMNRDQKASTCQQLAGAEVFLFFLNKKVAGLGVLGVNFRLLLAS